MQSKRHFDGIYARPKVQRIMAIPAPPPPPVPMAKPKRTPKNRGFVFGVIAAGATYFALAPYAPNWVYAWQHRNTSVTPVAQATAAAAAEPVVLSNQHPYFGKNTLQIASIGIDSEILEGVDENSLDRGLWRRPNTSTPSEGGNTVIAAHRFKYTTGPNTFYHLDKVNVGEPISLTWKGDVYQYVVQELTVVAATETSIELPTETPILTLYTCTPLWTSSKRLVVKAALQFVNGETPALKD